jgi:class 3 adenylate cyclase
VTLVLAVALIGAAAGLLSLYRRARRLERRLDVALSNLEHVQRAFSRFAPQEVVEQVIAHGVSTTAEKKEVVVLFADLKDFTRMSAGLDPAVLVEILNGYFSTMSRAITENSGQVSKFIGDGIMAFFGALERNPWMHNDAVRAALAMRTALAEYNTTLAAAGRPTLTCGIGIHRGVAVAGVIGSSELMEFTLFGDTVNLASRVEGLTRTHGVDILITESARKGLDPAFRLQPLPAVTVKGKSEPIATYAVLGYEAELQGATPC